MTTRFLLVLSLLSAFLAVWFYQTQGELDDFVALAETDIEYEATDILAIATDAQGRAEYLLTADSLTHYAQQNVDALEDMTLQWRPNAQKNIMISADKATLQHADSQVIMQNNVIFVSQGDKDNHASSANDAARTRTNPLASAPLQTQPLQLKAAELIGNLANKTIYSDQPIRVQQADNNFEAARFQADLVTGEYEFGQVAVTFMPPKRQDVALF